MFVQRIESADPRARVTYLALLAEPGKSLPIYVEPRVDPKTGQLFALDYNQVFVDPGRDACCGIMAGMQTEYHRWHSPHLGREMGVVVYGHYGYPMLVFPTSGGDEWEHQGQGMISTLAPFLDQGRIKIFTIAAVTHESFFNKSSHALHRSWMQAQYDGYVRDEVVPFIHSHNHGAQPITTMGASLGAYHAANTLFKHPDVVKRCYALSGVYNINRFMDGMYDDNVYFNNPVDYLQNLTDPWTIGQLGSCDIHIATGTGPWEHSGPSYELAGILGGKGIPHSLDDWGPQGGHDWPYWHHQMWTYVSQAF